MQKHLQCKEVDILLSKNRAPQVLYHAGSYYHMGDYSRGLKVILEAKMILWAYIYFRGIV